MPVSDRVLRSNEPFRRKSRPWLQRKMRGGTNQPPRAIAIRYKPGTHTHACTRCMRVKRTSVCRCVCACVLACVTLVERCSCFHTPSARGDGDCVRPCLCTCVCVGLKLALLCFASRRKPRERARVRALPHLIAAFSRASDRRRAAARARPSYHVHRSV